MFRHVVVFSFLPDTTTEQIDQIAEALRGLPAVIPELKAYHVGRDLGLVEGNWQFGVVADTDDAAGWRTYLDHPAHRAIADEQIRPRVAQRAAVQYEW